ncbi:MAG: lipopolysaccharide transport periplasmic protein LptA [Campylobacterota bacterium]|nr:lipopolysaccharide transport periplasmic protein LptA [Campylobacterota bacterium]
MTFLKTILFFLMIEALFAQKVEITSTSMRAENVKKEVHFIGDAKVKKLDDWLHADRVVVYFDENNETKMYEALGSVTFEFKSEAGHYTGSADKASYYPQKSFYVLSGDAVIDDRVNKSHVAGDEITLDMVTGNATVKSNKKKPVKFIIEMEDKR